MTDYIFPVKDFSDDSSASLSVLEFADLPWKPERIYWLYNFKTASARGNHAHKQLSQVFVMLIGSVVLDLYMGKQHEQVTFTTDSGQILIAPGTWRVVSSASDDALLLVVASHTYSEEDYIRTWDEYQNWWTNGLDRD